MKRAVLLSLLPILAYAEPYSLTVGNLSARDAKAWVLVYSRGADNQRRSGTLYSKKVPVRKGSEVPPAEVVQVPFLEWTETCASVVGATNPEATHCAPPRKMTRAGIHCVATIAPSNTPTIVLSCRDERP